MAKCKLKKSQLKQYEKEGRILHRHLRGIPPKVIASQLKITPTFINNTLGVLRKKGKEVLASENLSVDVIKSEVTRPDVVRKNIVRDALLTYMET